MNRSGVWIKQMEGYKAFIPTALPPDPSIQLEGELAQKAIAAKTALGVLQALSEGFGMHTTLLIAMYVRKEALMSAQIEGTQASLQDIFEFEQGAKLDNINDVEEVINYIKALNYGLKRLETLPMSLRLIKELHQILIKGVRGADKTPGEFRRSQNWIGPMGGGLQRATFVPPPVHEMNKALNDLEEYLYSTNGLPDEIKCGLIHYQFETIHPFLDGNGRLGRLLITLYFHWKKILTQPILYMSLYLKQNRDEYYRLLNYVRNTGNYEEWINFFLQGIIESAETAINDTKKIQTLYEKDKELLWQHKISLPYAYRLLDKLYGMPIVTIPLVSKELEITYPSAAKLVTTFETIGILKEITGKKRERHYMYAKYMAILSKDAQPL